MTRFTIPRTILIAGSCLFSSCAQMFMKDHGFKKSQAVEINGAFVNSGVKAMGGKGGVAISAMVYAAGTGTLDGPFIWRIEATGVDDVHEWLRVNEARVTTEKTKRKESFPKNLLGEHAKFEPLPGKKEKGRSFAKFQLPGRLKVFPRTDGKVEIQVNISIKAGDRIETRWVVFKMDPESKRRTETIFLPAEIVKSFRGNPREWDW